MRTQTHKFAHMRTHVHTLAENLTTFCEARWMNDRELSPLIKNIKQRSRLSGYCAGLAPIYRIFLEDPVNALFADAQHDTISDPRDSDVKNINGWRSLPIVESGVFERCAVCVRSVCGVCGCVRSCEVVCGCVRLCAAHVRRVGERRRCSLLNYTLVNLQCYLMGEDLLFVTEAQSVVGPRRKRRR
jgi:hypothetical protein